MSEEQKKIEELEGFKNLRMVDNFYQTSSFFPMPTTEIGTLSENGETNWVRILCVFHIILQAKTIMQCYFVVEIALILLKIF